MSEELKNIFDDFDPGVGDEHVEARWEAIRPLLPSEDKPRGFIYFRNNGSARALAIAALVLIVLSASLFFYWNLPEPHVSENKLRSTSSKVADKVVSPTLKDIQTNQPTSERIEKTDEKELPSQQSGNSNVSIHRKQVLPEGPGPDKQLVSAFPDTTLAKREKELLVTAPEINHVGQADQVPAGITENIKRNDEQVVSLASVQAKLPPGKEKEAGTTIAEVRPLRGISHKLTAELFAGVDRYDNSYTTYDQFLYSTQKADAGDHTVLSNGISYVIGASLHASVGRRLFIPMQLLYTGPKDVLYNERTGAIIVTQPIIGSVVDSTKKYREFTEVLTVKMQRSITLGLGIGTRLFASPMFTLNAMVTGELNRTTYVRANSVTFSENETTTPPASFTNTQVSAAIGNNSISAYDPNSTTSYSKNSYGASVSLQAARRLGQRMAITSRLSYHNRIQNTDLPGKYEMIRFRPKDLMLTLGISYQW